MNKYEVLYILAANLSEEAITANIDKYAKLVTDNGGEVDKIDKWGVKRLAYPINFKNDGFYVLMNFTAKPELIAEMDRVMRISDDVYRQMVSRIEA